MRIGTGIDRDPQRRQHGADAATARSSFPDARFVFCHRNPYEVFAASLERWERADARVLAESSARSRPRTWRRSRWTGTSNCWVVT